MKIGREITDYETPVTSIFFIEDHGENIRVVGTHADERLTDASITTTGNICSLNQRLLWAISHFILYLLAIRGDLAIVIIASVSRA